MNLLMTYKKWICAFLSVVVLIPLFFSWISIDNRYFNEEDLMNIVVEIDDVSAATALSDGGISPVDLVDLLGPSEELSSGVKTVCIVGVVLAGLTLVTALGGAALSVLEKKFALLPAAVSVVAYIAFFIYGINIVRALVFAKANITASGALTLTVFPFISLIIIALGTTLSFLVHPALKGKVPIRCTAGEHKGDIFPVVPNEPIIFGTNRYEANIVFSGWNNNVFAKHCSVRYLPDEDVFMVTNYFSTSDGVKIGNEGLEPNEPKIVPRGTKMSLGADEEKFILG